MDLRPLLHRRLSEAADRAREAICGLSEVQRESMPRVLAEAVVDVLIATGIGYRDLVRQIEMIAQARSCTARAHVLRSHGEHGNSGRKPNGVA